MKDKKNIIVSIVILIICIINLVLVVNVKKSIPNNYFATNVRFVYVPSENGEGDKIQITFALYSNNRKSSNLNPNDRVKFKCHTSNPNESYYIDAIDDSGFGTDGRMLLYEADAYTTGYKDITYCEFVGVEELGK